jgi:hypothetical protein
VTHRPVKDLRFICRTSKGGNHPIGTMGIRVCLSCLSNRGSSKVRLTDLQLIMKMALMKSINSTYIGMQQARLLMHQARRSLSSIRERAALQDVVLNLLSAKVEFSTHSHTYL